MRRSPHKTPRSSGAADEEKRQRQRGPLKQGGQKPAQHGGVAPQARPTARPGPENSTIREEGGFLRVGTPATTGRVTAADGRQPRDESSCGKAARQRRRAKDQAGGSHRPDHPPTHPRHPHPPRQRAAVRPPTHPRSTAAAAAAGGRHTREGEGRAPPRHTRSGGG